MTDDELFKPLSAKAGTRPKYSSGGRRLTGAMVHNGTAQKVRKAIERRRKDAARTERPTR